MPKKQIQGESGPIFEESAEVCSTGVAPETRSAPKRLRFTKTAVAGLECPPTGRLYVYDTIAGGLTICLAATGKKTWYVYRRVRGRPERLRLGTFPDLTVDQARDIARAVVGDIDRRIARPCRSKEHSD